MKLHTYNLLPGLFFAAGLALVLSLVFAREKIERDRVVLETSVTAEQLALRLQYCVDERLALVDTLAAFGWQDAAQLRDAWSNDAGLLYALQRGIQALNFVDPAGIITLVYPAETNATVLGADLRLNPNPSVQRALDVAGLSGTLTRTDIIELLQGGRGFTTYRRITSSSGELLGYVNGVFRVDDLVGSCLAQSATRDRFVFTLLEGEQVLYRYPESGGTARMQVVAPATRTTEVLDRFWRVTLEPSASYLQSRRSWFDLVWPGLGLGLMLVLSLALRALLLKQIRLKESQDTYRLLVENQTDMVVKVDTEGRFLYVSPSYCRLFGRSEAELLGHPFMPVVHEDDQERTRASLAALRLPPHRSYHEQRAMTPQGWRWLAWTNAAVFNDSGEIEAITGMGRDVTEAKLLEARMAHAQRMQAVGSMAGGVSHDFSNLLQVMLGQVEFLLQRVGDNDVLMQQLRKLRRVIDSAVTLTSRLATLSREQPAHVRRLELNEFADEFLALIRHSMPATINIRLERHAEPLHVDADPTQLEQVLLNLCFNARDAVDGSGTIAIKVDVQHVARAAAEGEAALKPCECACVSVVDDGCGIAPEHLSRIFDPFFTTKEKGRGTGLGLANCYSIIRRHEGEILVNSTPGNGSVFTVCLPRVAASPAAAAPMALAAQVRAPFAGGVTSCILVVDDDPEIQALICTLLEQAGYRTLRAGDGRQAVAAIEAGPLPDAVVMDVVMPQLDGREAGRRIKAMHPGLPILFVSGLVPNSAMPLNAPLLRKPFTRRELLDALQALLKGA